MTSQIQRQTAVEWNPACLTPPTAPPKKRTYFKSLVVGLVLSVLLVGACSAESGTAGRNGEGTAQSQTPPPKALQVQEYATTLAEALDPLESALKGLAKAKAYKGLNGRVTSVETAADQAVTELSQITPPAELAAEHSQLVKALKAFHGELGDVGSQVGDRALCTGSAVRAGLGDADGTSALRDALAAVSAKLPEDPARPDVAGGRSERRLASAERQAPPRRQPGRTKCTHHRQWRFQRRRGDPLQGKQAGHLGLRSQGQDNHGEDVPNGSYSVFFTFGAAWDASARAFGRNCAFQRFRPGGEDQLTFQNQGWVITLQRVAGGNSPTDDVDPNDFPDS